MGAAIVMGIQIITQIISSLALFKKGTTTTPTDQATAITAIATGVAGGIASMSKGGQANTANEIAAAIPSFHQLITDLMTWAETTGMTGTQKQAAVTQLATDALTTYQANVTGGAATTAAEIAPAVQGLINATFPVLFPKDTAAIENLQPS